MLIKEYATDDVMENARSVGNDFILHIPKSHKETITTDSGIEFFVDPKWNEVQHRAHTGRLVSAPKKLEGTLPKGCDVWFKHNVNVLKRKGATPQLLKDGYYWLRYTDDYEDNINNQALCYRDSDGSIKALGWNTIVEPFGSIDEEVKSSFFEVVSFKERKMNLGRVVALTDRVKEMFGITVGDVIYYKNNQMYEILIDGKKHYRVRPQGILGLWEDQKK